MKTSLLARIAVLALVALSFAGCGDDKKASGGDDDSSGSCPVSSSDCVDGCISTVCGPEISDCSSDSTCDTAKDTMVSCVCNAQRANDANAVRACLSTFTDQGGFLSTAFATCAENNCATPCDL